MPRVKKTSDYLIALQQQDYHRYNELRHLYDSWMRDFNIESLSSFLDMIWQEKDNIKPKYLGENTYNNFRGIAFEEFCFYWLTKIIKDAGVENLIELFWNQKILTEEFYLFDKGQFKKYPKYKSVDLVLGKSEGTVTHPFIILSCKIWQSTNWLDEDKTILDNIRSRYPDVVGYSLCTNLNVPRVSKISAQRTGLKVFALSKQAEIEEFISDINRELTEIKNRFF